MWGIGRRGLLAGLGLAALAPAAGASAAPGTAPGYDYLILDVFTDQPLTGNPLPVFLKAEGLSADTMMALTREFNLNETAFVFQPDDKTCDFKVRIFAMNEQRELPVAGHPTIGAVFALAGHGLIKPGRKTVMIQLGVGPTPIELEWEGDRLRFAWMTQPQPEFDGKIEDVAAVARALGLDPDDQIKTGLPVQQVSCGAPFLMVPLATRAAVDRADLDRQAMGRLLTPAGLIQRGVMIFSLEAGADGATAYSRMLGFGVTEGPATGNANGPLGAYLAHYGLVTPEKALDIISRQGVKMHRPSLLHISVAMNGGQITRVRLGGQSVEVGHGRIATGA